MAEYIFYITEGYTQDPKGNEVNNYQVLGTAFGENAKVAKKHLIEDNPWIKEAGFSTESLIVKQILPEE